MKLPVRIEPSTCDVNETPEPPRGAKGECHPLADGRWSCWPTDLSDVKTDPVTENDRLAYQVAVEHFRHDLVAFWNHSTFFALLQGALISVAVSSLGPSGDVNSAPAILSTQQLATLISVIGLLFGLFWALVAWRRATLIQKWREQVIHMDGRVNRHAIYLRIEPHVALYWWYGPTKLTVALPYLILSMWVIVLTVVWFQSFLLPVLFVVLSAWILVVIGGALRVRKKRRHDAHHETLT
jgi:hypothetical protein